MIKKILLLIFLNSVAVNIFATDEKLSPEKQAALDAWIGKIEKKQAKDKSERRKFLEANIRWIEKMSKLIKQETIYSGKAEKGDKSAITQLKMLEQKIFKGFDSQPFPPSGDDKRNNLLVPKSKMKFSSA